MAKRIHIEEDIFYLLTLIRATDDAFSLDIDSEMFLERIVSDFEFLDKTFESLIEALRENEKLIERGEQLKNLVEAEIHLDEVIQKILDGRGQTAAALAPFSERFREFRTRSRARRSEIDGLLDFPSEVEEPSLVSFDELNELLRES